MNILVFADTPYFKKVEGPKPDIVFLLGDIDYPVIRSIYNEFHEDCHVVGC